MTEIEQLKAQLDTLKDRVALLEKQRASHNEMSDEELDSLIAVDEAAHD